MSTYVDLVRAGARDRPDDVVYTYLVDGESREIQLTWAQLDRRSRAIAARLQELGIAGRRVLLIYPPGLDYVVAFFACLYAGVIAVPAYPPTLNRSISQLANIIRDAAIEIALTDGSVVAGKAAMTAVEPALARLSWLVTDEMSDESAADWREPRLRGDSIAFLQYTSGSTSTPKGAILTHGNLMHCGEATAARLVAPGTRMISWLPQYHDLGLFFGILQPVFGRNEMVLMSPVDFLRRPARWVQAISRYRVNATAAPNFAYDLCARKTTASEVAELDLDCWDVAINAAEPVRAATLDRFVAAFAGAGFRPSTAVCLYGLAEGLVVSTGPIEEPPRVTAFDADALGRGLARAADGRGTSTSIVSAGREFPGQRVAIVDALSRAKCAPGRMGEIWVSGPSVGDGYWNCPEAGDGFGARLADSTAPYLRTGDLGFFHEGQLYVTGRSKDVIIVRGRNVFPHDLELTAESCHAALRPGCVAAVDVGTSGEGVGDPVAIVQEVRPDWSGDLIDGATALHHAIATEHGLAVRAVVLIPAGRIPKTSSGKIRRHEVRRMLLAGEFDALFDWRAPAPDVGGGRQPRDDSAQPPGRRTGAQIEAWLVDMLGERLGLAADEVDIAAPFAVLGLGSVDAVEMTTELAEWLGCPVPTLIAWDHPTIEALARHLAPAASPDAHEPAA